MTIRQISVFVGNSTGGIADIADIVGKSGADIRALSIADTAAYGILRLIVDDPTKAAMALSEADYIVSVTDVIAAQIDDAPGGLSRALRPLSDAGISIEYAYAFVTRKAKNACVVLRVEDNDAASAILEANGVKLMSSEDICGF